MRCLLLTIVVAVLPKTTADDVRKNDDVKQIAIRVSFQQGDPSGSVQKKTVQIVAEPMFATLENMKVKYEVGNRVVVSGQQIFPFSRSLWQLNMEMTLGAIKHGKVEVNLSTTLSSKSTYFFQSAKTTSERVVLTVPLKEMQRHFIGGTPRNQVWMEFTVDEVDPLSAGSSRPLE